MKRINVKNEDFFEVHSREGKIIEEDTLHIGSTPLYIFILREAPQKVNCL